MRTGSYMHLRGARRPALRLAAAGILLGCLIGPISCTNPLAHSSSPSKRSSSLTVSIGPQESRSIVAGSVDYFAAIAACMVTASNVSDATETYTSTTVSSGVCTITDMIAGTYDVTVQAYSDAARTNQIAMGSASSKTIDADSTTDVPVTLSFTQSASTGGFSLPVQWPLSTGLAYIYATLDGTAIAVPTVTTGATYSATLSASALSGGVHVLDIYFKTSSAATAVIGPYLESVNIWDGVTDSMWADPGGNLYSTLSFGADEFANTDTSLACLSVATVGLGTAFAPGMDAYNFGAGLTADNIYDFTITAGSTSQGIACTFNDVPLVLTASSPTTLTGSFPAASGLNTLKVVVTAADRETSRTYVVTTAGLVASSADWAMISMNLSGSYVLAADMDTTMSGGLVVIGSTALPFTGTFDGGGHSIILNSIAFNTNTGLFDTIGSSGVVKNLSMSGSILTSQANGYVGTIAGENYGTITNCTSSVTVSTTSANGAGGIVGYNESTGVISCCASTGSVSSSGDYAGGIAGTSDGRLYHCYATGAVHTNDTGAGGLVGISGSTATIVECYATGNVTAGMYYCGGLIGENDGNVLNSYARGWAGCGASYAGGLIGIDRGGVSFCYATGPYTGEPGGYLVGLDYGGPYMACYVSDSADTTYYLSTLSSAVPAPYPSLTWGWSASINDGYPYLLYFGNGTHVP